MKIALRSIALATLFLSSVLVTVAPAQTTKPSKPPAKPTKPTPPKPPAVKPLPPTTAKLYSLLGVKSLFIQGNGRAPLADSLRETLSSVGHHGFVTSTFWPADVEALFQATPIGVVETPPPAPVNPDPAAPVVPPQTPKMDPKLEAFEAKMISVLVKYATYLSTGIVTPNKVGTDVRIDKKGLSVEALAEALRNTSVPLKESLEALSSQWPMYRRLQEAMKRMQLVGDSGSFPAVKAPAKNYKIGDSDENIRALKMRLQALGYPVENTDAVYSESLKSVVKEYLVDHGINGTGDVTKDSGLWASIGVSAQTRVEQIKLQMEKLRWLPTNPETKHIFVNLAFQQIAVYESSEKVLEMKVINGRPKRPTPTLRDRLPVVELNPSWTVPPRIVIFDKIEAIQNDPNYLRKNNFILLDRDMNPIESWGGGWGDVNLNDTESYYLRQLPGTGNALGVLKFHLNNPYAIYLHDTNEKNLFDSRGRLLSSGCIRLERPQEMANYLLKGHKSFGTPSALEQNLAKTRLADKKLPWMFKVTLDQPVPVYTMYLSAMVNEKGRILFASDAYTQDKRLQELITFGAVKTKSPADIENEELKRREQELREGGGFDEDDWRREERDREREREREERDNDRRRRRGDPPPCNSFWC